MPHASVASLLFPPHARRAVRVLLLVALPMMQLPANAAAVSYTHLTLPTKA